jgi:hypothetical protein
VANAVAVIRQCHAGLTREKENAGQADCAVKRDASQDTEPTEIAHHRPDGFLQVINLTPIEAASSKRRHDAAAPPFDFLGEDSLSGTKQECSN